MRHLVSGSKLGRQPAHRRATLRNLVTNLIEKERIQTTLLRAKAARPIAERMITLGKRDSLHSRRQAAAFLMTPGATKKLFADLAPRFADRPGGYTRIIRTGWRIGDGAELAILEFIGSELKKKEKKPRKAAAEETPERREGSRRGREVAPFRTNRNFTGPPCTARRAFCFFAAPSLSLAATDFTQLNQHRRQRGNRLRRGAARGVDQHIGNRRRASRHERLVEFVERGVAGDKHDREQRPREAHARAARREFRAGAAGSG